MAASDPIELVVLRSAPVTPHMHRVVLGGDGFDEFVGNGLTDAYVKLRFGPAEAPTLRTYTVRKLDAVAREIWIDFVVHGDEGIAGPWAANAKPGDTLVVWGPGGGYRPDPTADWHLLAGDESALPAIAAAVEALAPTAIARIVIEVGDASDRQPLDLPAGATLTWVERTDDDQAPLIAAVRAVEWLPGRPQVFIHGEADAVMKHLRPYIRGERGVEASRASISGYWRRGRTEEGFREWKAELAAAER